MAAYAALASLAQITDLDTNQNKSLFSIDAEEKIRSIYEYVSSLLSFLEDFPEKASSWEGKMRDLAYKAEDIIESLMWQKIESRRKGIYLSRDRLEERLGIVTEDIGLIAGEVMEERPDAVLPATVSSSSSSRLAAAGNEAVIGLDGDLLAVKERLCRQSSNLQIIPIVGMGGIGKTTLARTVYNDQLIVEHFDIRAWLTVSQDCSPRRLMALLFEQMPQHSGIDESEELFVKIYKSLKFRRYLIVLDDVWDTRVWDDIRNMFPDDGKGSRIMITSRELGVAVYPDRNSPLHEMRIMDESHSWDLLKQKVFPNGDCPLNLEDVGKRIARSCAGLPLAVVLVAGLLSAVNDSPASWEEIAGTVKLVVGRGSEEILSLSYTQLPPHLRPCFLFIGGFPEDATISASRLIKLWVAEGFLKHENGYRKSLEEEAEEYLEDLVKRNLIAVASKKTDGKIKRCSLHDMIRDMCIRIAHKEKFLHAIDGRDPPQGLIIERRISFNRSDISDIDNNWGQTIRSILCFFPAKVFYSWLSFLGSFKLLKVLDSLGVSLDLLHSGIFELYHLRYLAFTSYDRDIPSAISNLVNLQTLIICQHPQHPGEKLSKYGHIGHPLYCLPVEIWRMPQLRHIVLCNLYTVSHPPNCLTSILPLENLHTILHLTNLVWNEKLPQMIPNVKRLRLLYTSNLQVYHLHHLKYLHQLEKLEVYGCGSFSWQVQNPSFPYTLKKLTLVGGRFPWEDMGAIIGSLPSLQVLKLLENACCGDTWETNDVEFPQLNFLEINESRLQHWITQSSPFPRLKCLMLRSCQLLNEIPEGIGEIPTLELIQVEYCNLSLMVSAEHIKVDQESCGNDALQVCYTCPRRWDT